MKKRILYLLAIAVVAVTGCQKELSLENGNTPAEGSLQDDALGDCLPKTVNGTYSVAVPLVATTNTITVAVDVTRTGSYTITTDTVNGCYFRAVGIFTNLGVNNVTLRGNGTPFAAGTFNYIVSFDGTFCDVQVTVTSPGVGTLAGAPNACAPITVNGGYSPGVALTASNNAQIQVNVITAGGFNITTDTIQGLWFSFAGNIAATGNQPVILQAQGSTTALTTGSKTFTVKLGSSRCTFVVDVAAPAQFTINCAGAMANGTYTVGIPLTTSNTITIPITVTTPGSYSITASINGMTFSGSGTLTGTSTSITLNGSTTTTPTGPAGNYNLSVGTPACLIPITVVAGGSSFTADCTTASPNPDGLYEVGTQLNCANTVDIDINVTGLGPFSITTTANGMTFSASGTFTTLGVQTITLVGSGTPLIAGPTNIPIPGTTPCSFSITVDAAPTIDWQFTKTNAPSTIFRGQTDIAQLVPNGTSVIFGIDGSNSIGADALLIVISDVNGTITAGETYSTSALPTGNFAVFSYDFPTSCSDTLSADFSVTGVSMTFTVTTHNVATSTITGTFTGTAKNSAGQTININGGTFRGTY